MPSNGVNYWNFGGPSYTGPIDAAAYAWTVTPTVIYLYSQPPSGATNLVAYYYSQGNDGHDAETQTPGCDSQNGPWKGLVYSYYNTYYTDRYDANARQQVMVHEMGHALGLNHDGSGSCNGMPIMFASSDRWFRCGLKTPQQDDNNGINSLYH